EPERHDAGRARPEPARRELPADSQNDHLVDEEDRLREPGKKPERQDDTERDPAAYGRRAENALGEEQRGGQADVRLEGVRAPRGEAERGVPELEGERTTERSDPPGAELAP